MTTSSQLGPRFKPVRAGLLNLFEYSNQVFEFADGHLLLRGHNGAGKSKALELLLPFVLDGDTHPTKLDPFATTAREMKWNLTLGGRHESRWGYAWLEFGRQVDGADAEWVTLAVGVKAHHQMPGSQTWFLVIPGRRVGHDISLVNPQSDTPRLRRGIREALGDDVEVFDEAYAYRERVNQLLFGFGTVERYETMLELQRQLRRPQLSKSLNPQQLSDILTDALPEVDGRLVSEIGAHLDAIEQLRQDLRALTGVRDGFRSFVGTYQAYARAVVAQRAEEVLTADRSARLAQSELNTKRRAAREAEETTVRLAREAKALAEELQRRRGAVDELLKSDAVRSARELDELREAVGKLATQVRDLDESAEQARIEANDEREQQNQHELKQEESEGFADVAVAEMGSLAGTAGIAHHQELAAQIRESERPEAAAKTMRDAVADRRRDIARQRELRGAAERDRVQAEAREGEADRAVAHVSDAEERLAVCEDLLAAERQGLIDATQEWVEALDVLVLSDVQAEVLLDTAQAAGDPEVSLSSALDEPVGAHQMAWVRTELELKTQREALEAERAPLEAEQAQLQADRTPVPATPPSRTADREDRPGAPLWRLLDFRDGMPESDRAGLEAALEMSGLLDAWVLPTGKLLDVDGDIALTVSQPADGAHLGQWLHAVDGAVAPDIVDAVLAGVGTGDTAAPTAGIRVDVDGSFRAGPAVGRSSKPVAQYVGAAAREANRARRLAELETLLSELDARDAELVQALANVEKKRGSLKVELASLPAEAGARSAFAAVRNEERHLTTLRSDAAEARRQSLAAAEAAAGSLKAAARHAHEHRLPSAGAQPTLESLDAALNDYGARISELVHHTSSATQHADNAAAAAARAVRADSRADGLDDQRKLQSTELQRRRGALDVLEQARGEEAESALAQLERLRADIESLEAKSADTAKSKEAAAIEHAQLQTAIASDETVVEQRGVVLSSRLTSFRALEQPDFLCLAVEDAAPGPRAAQQWNAGHVGQFVRDNASTLRPTASVEALTNRVTADFSRLEGELDGSVGVQPFRERHDDIEVVAATRAGQPVSVRTLLSSLDEEIEAQERNLTEQDQKTFERFLFRGIAQHLRIRITGAQRLVEDTNTAIANCQTSSGMSVELAWDPMADDDPLLKRSLQLLRSAPEALSDVEREQLIRFFRDRVEDARLSQGEGTATQHLLDALDYRQWHRFRVLQTKDGVKVPLTKKQHEAGSGGEKAAALHLPLFAAAAAHMQSAAEHAPRLVMLDEAFAGIDGKMRPQLLGLIEAFDLDFLLTSHELWCCERELEHLSIYQLHREEGTPGVASVHFLWDGAAGVRREVDESDVVAA